MLELLLLSLFLFIYFALVIIEEKWQLDFDLAKLSKKSKKISSLCLFLIVFILVGIVISIFLFASNFFIKYYLEVFLSLLILGHAFWLSRKKSLLFKFVAFLLSFVLVSWRLISPSIISNNFFILGGVLWLGPFLKKINLVNLKRFIIVSLLWFLYDLTYVWLTNLSKQLTQTTEAAGLPLAIYIGKSSIGTADLLWSGLFISLISGVRTRLISIFALVLSDFLLGLYFYLTNSLVFFPLLVLWVPLGLLIIKCSTLLKAKKL